MQAGFVIALIKALLPRKVEQLSAAGGSGDAGKILVVGADGNIKTETLVVDSELSESSTNPIQNKAVAEYVDLSSAQISTLTGLLE